MKGNRGDGGGANAEGSVAFATEEALAGVALRGRGCGGRTQVHSRGRSQGVEPPPKGSLVGEEGAKANWEPEPCTADKRFKATLGPTPEVGSVDIARRVTIRSKVSGEK